MSLLIVHAQAGCSESILGTGVNIFKDDLTKPADLQGQQIFNPHDCVQITFPNETTYSMDILQTASDFQNYFQNMTAVPFLTSAIEDSMRQYDPVYENNTDAFTVARRIFETRSLKRTCLGTFTLQERLKTWMDLLSVNMTSISDWRLWQALVDSFHLSHVVMSVSIGVQLQIFVSCPARDQTFWTSCGDSAQRGLDASTFGCPQSVLSTCGASGGYSSQEFTVLGGDPILGMQLVLGKMLNNSAADTVLEEFLASGDSYAAGARVPLRVESLVSFSDILRGVKGDYQEQAAVLDEVIGDRGYMQCVSTYAGTHHWQRTTQDANGRWIWTCAQNAVSPPTPEDVFDVPWVSVVVISGVSSALLVSLVYYLCQRIQKRRRIKTDVIQQRTGNYYKDLAALTSDE